MVSSNAFGFERLDQVYTAEYRIDGMMVTTYISERASAEEAAELASAFSDYFLQFGGQELETGFPSPNGKTIEIMDSFNIIFSNGAYLAGVYEAINIEFARKLASRLHKQIASGAVGFRDAATNGTDETQASAFTRSIAVAQRDDYAEGDWLVQAFGNAIKIDDKTHTLHEMFTAKLCNVRF